MQILFVCHLVENLSERKSERKTVCHKMYLTVDIKTHTQSSRKNKESLSCLSYRSKQ